MASDRLFVAQIVIAIEDQWFAPNTDGPPIRTERHYAIHQQLFAALDEEHAYRIVTDWLEQDAFSDDNHDGPGDLTRIFALGIHQLEEVVRLSEVQLKSRGIYGINLPGFHFGDIDSQGVPIIRQKQDMETFRLLGLLGPRRKAT